MRELALFILGATIMAAICAPSDGRRRSQGRRACAQLHGSFLQQQDHLSAQRLPRPRVLV